MIGKGKAAIAHGGNAIDYALREGKQDKIVGRKFQHSFAISSLFTPNTPNPAEDDYYNNLKHNKKKKRRFGRQQ